MARTGLGKPHGPTFTLLHVTAMFSGETAVIAWIQQASTELRAGGGMAGKTAAAGIDDRYRARMRSMALGAGTKRLRHADSIPDNRLSSGEPCR